jgi:murein L,D-transpeptidase YafK
VSKLIKYFFLIILLAISVYFLDKHLPPLFAENLPKADRIIVLKSERKLFLLKDTSIIKTYNISLGKNPVGVKQMEGDSKTPEGKYIIDWRNKGSKYHLSLHISYPNKVDSLEALERGFDPGGNIMIHGRPNYIGWLPFIFDKRDWTDGCIAVTNVEIEEIWNSVVNNTEIFIKE